MSLRGIGSTERVVMEKGRSKIDVNVFLMHKIYKNTKSN